jgi:NAD(P)-dependent dehydrogenase (short-subunit alcohol dehydrogenase family)
VNGGDASVASAAPAASSARDAAPSPHAAPCLHSLPNGYRALVIGASGAIGAAFFQHLQADPRCAQVLGLHRHGAPRIDYADESSVAEAAAALRGSAPWSLVLVATGVLHSPDAAPEKRLADLAYGPLESVFRTNTFGPAMVLRHFAPLLAKERSVLAVLSAKVGSVGDNRLGGWYAYRASKAALNMLVKTAAIEVRRTHPGAVLVALHPGTVSSALSRPFKGDDIGQPPAQATAAMLAVLDTLQPEDSGSFLAYNGQRLPW